MGGMFLSSLSKKMKNREGGAFAVCHGLGPGK
jgi:hypothetical protein